MMMVVVKVGLQVSFPGVPFPIPTPDLDLKAAGIDLDMNLLVDLSEKLVDDVNDSASPNAASSLSKQGSSTAGSSKVDINWGDEGVLKKFNMVRDMLTKNKEIRDPNLEHTGLRFVTGQAGGPNGGISRWIYDLKAVEDSFHTSEVGPTVEAIKAIQDHKKDPKTFSNLPLDSKK